MLPASRLASAALSLLACGPLVCAVAGCAEVAPATPVWASSSSTIVLAPDTESLWVTSPDDDALVEVGTIDLLERRRIAIDGGPEQLALAGERAVVTLGRATSIAIVELATGEVVDIPVPCGGTRGVAVDEDGRAWITCPNDHRVVAIDVEARSVLRVVEVRRPIVVAISGDRVIVTSSERGVCSIAIGAEAQAECVAIESAAGFAASQLDAIVADARSGRVAVAYQRVDHDSDRARPADRGGYGSVVDGAPRIEPRLLAPCGSRFARFDGGARVLSGPSALAWSGERGLLWVAGLYTDDVMLLACPAPTSAVDAQRPWDESFAASGELEWRGTFRVGGAPRGIVITDDGGTAYVDLGFDHAVARLVVPERAALVDAELTRRRTLEATRWSAAALRGRSDFHDAVDTHLTPSGVVTCATCHPGGGDDGLAWFLHTTGIPRKVRRTPPAWAARSESSPFHWDGAFDDASALAGATIRELMEGDGLLVDLDAIATYMSEIPMPPRRPLDDAERAAAERGRALFESAEVACATCHAGAMLTDRMSHDVLPLGDDPDAALAVVDTPTLIAVRSRASFFHDGRASTLADVLARGDDRHGRTSHLTNVEIDDLLTYLGSL